MPPKKVQNIEEKRKAKREREKKRRAKIKEDPVKYEQARKKEKERRQKRKNEKKILLINDLTPRQQKIQRKEWRERNQKHRANKKKSELALRAIRDETPSTDCDIRSRSSSITREDRYFPPDSPSTLRDTPIMEDPKTPIHSESDTLSSRSSASCTSTASRQRNISNRKSKNNQKLARLCIQKQEKIILIQKKQIKALQRKLQRLTQIANKNLPIAARKRQNRVHQQWIKRKEAVRQFLENDENSMISPGVKDTITKNKTKKQKRYLCDSMEKLHQNYNLQSPQDLQLSYASFCRLRPFWVLRAKLTDRDTCLCVTHENFGLMMDRLKALKIILDHDVISNLVCDKNSYQCMTRKCSQCITKMPEIGTFEDDEIAYHQWISKDEDRNIKGELRTVKRTVKERILITKKTLLQKFIDDVPKFLEHKININIQHKTLTYIKEHVKEGEILVRVDFSENYACKYYKEAQSVHFGASRQQVSIHTGVFYFLSSATGETDVISFCSVSPCLRHDASAIYAHLKKALTELIKGQDLHTLHIASDGPSNQYKNKNNIYLFTQHLVNVLGISNAIWHFSESGHGKGPADGVGAAVKEISNNYVRKGNDVPDYESFVSVVKKNCNVLLYEVTEDDIKEGDNLLRSEKIKNLAGIKKMHQVSWNRADPRMINMRELTCTDCGITDHCIHYFNAKQKIVQIPELVSTSAPNLVSEGYREGVWVVAKFIGAKNKIVLYVGQIISVHKENEPSFLIKFLRKKYHSLISSITVFNWKEPEDLASLDEKNIVGVLPEPTPTRRGELNFKYDFSKFKYPIM